MGMDKIVILTDIEHDPIDLTHSDALLNEEVDEGLNTFLCNIKGAPSSYRLYKDKNQLILALQEAMGYEASLVSDITDEEKIRSIIDIEDSREGIEDGREIFIFYSGHADELSSLLLPNDEMLTTDEFHDIIRASLGVRDKLFITFDCCHGNGFNLPFYLDMNVYKYIPGNSLWFKPEIVCFSSSTPNVSSVATRLGSDATRVLCESLKKSGYLADLKRPTTTVTSSRPGSVIAWSWLRGYNDEVEVGEGDMLYIKRST